jgi:glycosyltransferase involved in cell wall biosynthesis
LIPDGRNTGAIRQSPGLKLVVYHAGSGLGGVEVSVATLLRNLDPRIEVLLIGSEPSVLRWFSEQVPRAEVRRIPGIRNKWDFGEIANQMRVIRQLRPDILQVDLADPWSSGKYAVLAGLLAPGVKVIVGDYTGMPPHNKQARWAKKILMSRASANVAVSRELARFIEDAARVRRHSIRVIYQGISDPGPPAAVRRRRDPPVIGTVARLTRQKGIDVFLRVLADIPRVRGVVVGEGEDEEELKLLATELGLGERVSWMGWSDNPRTFLEDFDVFVLASRWEGFGRVLVEAALAECPVVATRVVGTSEAMIEGETGLLVPPGDKDSLGQAISSLLEDEAGAREMGKRGRHFARTRFDPAMIAREYESLYAEVLGYSDASAIRTSKPS